MRYALVKLDRAVAELAAGLTYAVPERFESDIGIGSLVGVPLRQDKAKGIVVALSEEAPGFAVRPLLSLLDDVSGPSLNDEQLALIDWLSEHYLTFWSQALGVVLPPVAQLRLKRPPRAEHFQLGQTRNESGEISPGRGKILALWQRLRASGAASWTLADLRSWPEYDSVHLRKLLDKGLLRAVGEPCQPSQAPQPLPLTLAQQEAMAQLRNEFAFEKPRPVLLHGVTGSGKTELYLQLIAQTLTAGRECLVLVPEITLTVQLMDRFRARFGDDVAVMHSGLGDAERNLVWNRARSGNVRVIVGARSAVFAPFKNLGLIVLDEEHEQTFKHEEDPKYHAREVALWRAAWHGAHVILGSATPAIESYRKALQGDYRLVTLAERVRARPMARVDLVDMRRELREGCRSIFSRALQADLREIILRREQAILFHNRRGYHRMTLCRSCGCVLECPECEIPLVEHLARSEGTPARLKCHTCGFERAMPEVCPQCGSSYFRFFGIGTEKVVEECQKLFPEARILRLDADSARHKGSKSQIVRSFSARQAEILVGTQMVAKGLDFPSVTLVGILSADGLLRAPDYRGAERAFALLTQVSGRAGRGELPGRVILQSYAPEHPLVQAVQEQNYAAFYEAEIVRREKRQEPPFASLAWILAASVTPQNAFGYLQILATTLTGSLQLRGPLAARQYRLSGRYRFQLLLKAAKRDELLEKLRQVFEQHPAPSDVMLSVTVDPLAM